jgi:pyruvate/2-oxoacid:ferredoxin oxidoreductase beta subunit
MHNKITVSRTVKFNPSETTFSDLSRLYEQAAKVKDDGFDVVLTHDDCITIKSTQTFDLVNKSWLELSNIYRMIYDYALNGFNVSYE